ncbi:MAG TPA: hypothetical protein VLF40_00635 [Candidatus Saccharimonadales bacterium]|nr:hypothetical protein [Candidatus Saccharimonadales bacterium]
MKTILLILAAVITIAGAIPYLRGILRGTTKPNLVSWITWTLLTGIATAAAISAHEYVVAIFTGAATLEVFTIVLFGLRHGYVKYTRFDVICQVAAIVGIILWQLFNSPAVGVMAAVIIDLVGYLPTLRHSWQKPHEETWQTYAISGLGAVFALGALSTYNWVTLPYAIYIVVVNILASGVIIYRARVLAAAV